MRSLCKKRLMMRRAEKFINGSSFSFSSLPYDVVLNCLSRVPRCYYSNLSRVSKTFRSLVRSPELARRRSSLIGKNNPVICVCFTEADSFGRIFHWFTYDAHEKKISSALNSIPVLPRQMMCCSIVSLGSTIYFIGGSMSHTSTSIRFLDPWSGELCEGPSMNEARMLPGVTVVDGKLYVMGGCGQEQIQVEVFDPETQTWEVGPLNPHVGIQYGQGIPSMRYGSSVTESVDVEGKVYGMSYSKSKHIIYNTKDGICETFEMKEEKAWRRGGVCAINNVIYVYYKDCGLMWYDSKDKVWRMVHGFKLDKGIGMPVGMVDYNGKLAVLWEDLGCIISKKTKMKKIWCTIVVLDRIGGVAIRGTVKWSRLVCSVPIYYDVWRCLHVSD
ncbi:Kelch-type beta propeller [Arabidopsis thaliana x Arabidopsis arenosa]|uniref:Kelch-type beta propeller n=1 Tax=Arabidopsis thaliana x Arabidopsis arenosa TaxID=1240361 RepID=A0A8T2A138_9BRAS|nr:Kelch-type beta propeller [Arabidopsis thaliana x Arabidopsis arenosa]